MPHLRPPSIDRGISAFLWAAALGFYVYLGLVAVGTTRALGVILAALSFCAIFLFAFVPVAIVALWVIVAGEPANAWLHRHVLAWSSDIHVRGVVNDVMRYIPVFAFGTGLVFGFSFDTTGPTARQPVARRRGVAPAPVEDRTAADEPVAAERRAVPADRTRTRDGEYVGAPAPEAPPRTRTPE